jgi:uncharacterized protein
MEEKDRGGLQHTPARAALRLGSSRTGIIARGRRAAADAAANPDFGQGVAEYRAGNFREAAESFRRAAEQGHAEAQYILSTMYDAGQGVEQDDAEAARWERKAAEQGHAYAQANLSFRYYQANEFGEAFAWCQRAAHSQLPWAMFNVGLMYRKGEGVEQSNTDAARWYRLAALKDYAEAQLKLAELYYLGLGIPQSYKQAAAWYRKAAELGNAEAQFQLGQLYATGQGVEHDYVQHRQWIRRAAEQGHEQARRELKRREYRDP